MQDPDKVLEELKRHSLIPGYKFDRLYRLLYNPSMYLMAFQNIYANKGALTYGSSDVTISGFGMDRIERIITALKDRTYQPHPARRIYIAKKNSSKLRPLGISEGDDKVIQEVVKMILEAIYEPRFSDSSHGFRPNKSCHTALDQIQHQFRGGSWFIEGDIHACFDSFNHQVLISILRERITDEAFIQLTWKLLKAGYMENWVYVDSYTGVPQGSGCSPVLCNIYLDKLDQYMAAYKSGFDTEEQKYKDNPAYKALARKAKKLPTESWNSMSEKERKSKIQSDHNLKNQMRKMASQAIKGSGIRKLTYVRYADDFLICVCGSKEDARKVKEDIKIFLDYELCLELSDQKTVITRATDRAKFLGYEVSISCDNNCKKTKQGIRRVYNGEVRLYMPRNIVRDKLLKYGVIQIKYDSGTQEIWRPMPRKDLAPLHPYNILNTYNAEIRGILNYYRMACNVSNLGHLGYLMERSCQKTLGTKYRTRFSNIAGKFMVDGILVATYRSKNGKEHKVEFYHDGFHTSKKPVRDLNDISPAIKISWRREITRRYEAHRCELCGEYNKETKIFLIRKVKDLGNTWLWEQKMKAMHRKSLMTCPACYEAIINGNSPRAAV